MWRTLKCNLWVGANTVPPVTGQLTTRFQASSYRTDNVNIPNFVATLLKGTVFELRQGLHLKEATGVENLKMKALGGYQYRTSRYGTANYPVSCIVV